MELWRCIDVSNATVMADLRRYLVRLGIIKAAHVVLPRQELLRQILMSAGSDSATDIAADAGTDGAMATDAQQV